MTIIKKLFAGLWPSQAESAKLVGEYTNRSLQQYASDHLYGFVAFITTQRKPVTVGCHTDCAPIMDLLQKYMHQNGIGDPSEEYPNTFVMPDTTEEFPECFGES